MNRIIAYATAVSFLLSPSMLTSAETFQPVEVLPGPGSESGIADRDEFLAKTSSVKLFIQGTQLSVEVEVELANRTNQPTTTNLNYQLPASAKLTDFSLDAHGQIPALHNGRLAGIVSNNMFSAPNFELPAHGRRTFQISYSATYDPHSGISIPINTISQATWMTIMVDAKGLPMPPQVTLPNGQIKLLTKQEDVWRATFADAPYRTLMQNPGPILVSGGECTDENLHIAVE